VAAARLSGLSEPGRWQSFFENDAIEEYWHCDVFYNIDAPDLKVPKHLAQVYLPLPASLAFEQQTYQVAEKDKLAHLMVAYGTGI
jgi:hypothetical protein